MTEKTFKLQNIEKEIMPPKEQVNHPSHYGGDSTYECIKVLKSWLPAEEFKGFCRANAIKYLCRVGKKDNEIQELEKARWYIDELIKSLK